MYALEYFNSYVLFKKEYVNFKLASLNVRGIRSSTKRKALFTWLNEQKYDIIFLQETYSTVDVEYIWKTQWKGKLYFSHGSNHSCGVMVLVRGDLDFELISINSDDDGRSIVMEAVAQESSYLFVNIYAPNRTQDQCRFFDKLNNNIEDCVANKELKIILGGDFNVTFDSDLDCSGGRPFTKDSIKNVQNLCFDFDLVDIWRIRNPARRRFTWRQKSPFIQRRLDYWLISDVCQDEIEMSDIIPSINSDHSAIFLQFNSIEKSDHGPSFWKFNASLVDDEDFVTLINESVPKWLDEFSSV